MRKILRFFLFLLTISLLFGIPLSPTRVFSAPLSVGFSFSPSYAEDLGLDPKTSYLEILESFDFTSVRIPVYWNRVFKDGSYDFSEVRFLAAEAKRRGLEVVLSFGYRNFRWPECHAPEYLNDLDYASFEEEVLSFAGEVLGRFAGSGLVDFWQVENEPFLHFTAHCRALKPRTLAKVIGKVKNSSDKPVVITLGGGEVLGLPLIWPLTDGAEIIGVSFYPHYHEPIFGSYIKTYRLGPIPPRKISRERAFVEGKGKGFWVIESQAEPWAEDPRTMSPEILRSNWELLLSYGGAERVYLWGVEWWLKEEVQGRPEVLEVAKDLFGPIF